jgi:hypothetical protein
MMEAPEGTHFRFEHCRNFSQKDGVVVLSPLGGTTICYLEEDRTNKVLAEGYANCSKTEQYVKKIGRDISSGRALKAYNWKEDLIQAQLDAEITG